MSWFGRILAMLVALVVVTCPLYIASLMKTGFDGLGYFLMFGLAFVSGLVAIGLVAIPGLAWLHRRRMVGIRPRLGLVLAVGTAMGVVGFFGLAVLGGSDELRPVQLPILVAAGIAIALPAAGIYVFLVRAAGGDGVDGA